MGQLTLGVFRLGTFVWEGSLGRIRWGGQVFHGGMPECDPRATSATKQSASLLHASLERLSSLLDLGDPFGRLVVAFFRTCLICQMTYLNELDRRRGKSALQKQWVGRVSGAS